MKTITDLQDALTKQEGVTTDAVNSLNALVAEQGTAFKHLEDLITAGGKPQDLAMEVARVEALTAAAQTIKETADAALVVAQGESAK